MTDRRRTRSTKRIIHNEGLLHVETPLGIVDIRVGLHDGLSGSVDSIEIIPDQYSGEKKVKRYGCVDTRLVQCKTITN